jgi:septal ring factor EnvC (AmiA/AmiB activator)
MLHQFESKYANFIYAIISNPEFNDDERSKLIAEMMDEFKGNYPNLQNTVTTRELSEMELRLTKEIEQIRVDMEHLRVEIKEMEIEAQKDRDKIRLEIKELDNKLSKEIRELDTRLTKEIKELDTRLTKEIQQTKSDLLKWSFVFWISQISVISGVGFFIYKAINLG